MRQEEQLLTTAKRKIVLLCALIAGLILAVMTTLCLMISVQEARRQAEGDFQTNAFSLLLYLERQPVISHAWISQMEKTWGMIIDIEDQGHPLQHSLLHDHSPFQELLRDLRAELADPLSSAVISYAGNTIVRQLLDTSLRDGSGSRYYGFAASLPSEQGSLSVAMLSQAKQPGLLRQGLRFTLPALLAWVSITLLAWLLIGSLLRPVQESRRRQTAFIAAASHELRTPLASLNAALEAADKSQTGQTSHFLSIALEEGQRMGRLTEELLTLAGADSQRWTIQPSPCQPDTLLLNLWERYEPLLLKHGVTQELRLPEQASPVCVLDEDRVCQILSIFLENALMHAAPSQITLALEVDDSCCRFLVADDGVGIPDAEKPRLLERFYRGDTARHDSAHFGLGLSIAGEIASLHGGSIRISDTPGGGATFELILPR